jgi:hypothetical protein
MSARGGNLVLGEADVLHILLIKQKAKLFFSFVAFGIHPNFSSCVPVDSGKLVKD